MSRRLSLFQAAIAIFRQSTDTGRAQCTVGEITVIRRTDIQRIAGVGQNNRNQPAIRMRRAMQVNNPALTAT